MGQNKHARLAQFCSRCPGRECQATNTRQLVHRLQRMPGLEKNNVSKFISSKKEVQQEAAVSRTLAEVFIDLDAKQPGLGTALQNYGLKKGSQGKLGGKATGLGTGYANEREDGGALFSFPRERHGGPHRR